MSEKDEALADAMRLVLADAFETYAAIPPGLQRVAAIPCVVSRTELSQAVRLLRRQHAEIERLRELLTEAKDLAWAFGADSLRDRINAALRREDV